MNIKAGGRRVYAVHQTAWIRTSKAREEALRKLRKGLSPYDGTNFYNEVADGTRKVISCLLEKRGVNRETA
jgi:hypothetical protein